MGVRPQEPETELKPPERVQIFYATASKTARRLAGYLAAVPLCLPLMRLVQQQMLPDSWQIHLAEVFVGGLLMRLTPAGDRVPADEVWYDFHPGVRELLVWDVPVDETLRVLALVEERLGVRVLPRERAAAPPPVDLARARPFAEVAVKTLRTLGGPSAARANALEAELQRPRLLRDRGEGVRRISREIGHNRRVLVIGSQCASLPPLSFLPQAAVDLHAVMTDPEVGGCTDAAPRGLLIDPTVAEARAAIKEAFRAAAAEEATLLLALIGHGTYAGRDFYLLPHDGVEPPDSDTGVQLVQLVKEQHRLHPGLDGLVVLIDTCFSGVGALAAATYWVSELEGALRFEVLTAAADRPAYDGCFTRQLVACLREGLDGIPGEYLRSEHVQRVIEGLCPHQKPQHPTYNADEGLYLAKNVVHARRSVGPSWAGTAAAETIQRLTAWLQPTPVLHEVVARSQEGRYVAVVGLAGSGKSALAAALARPEVTEGTVPSDFVQAVAFLTSGTLTPEVASTLSDQLARSLPGFAATRDRFQQALTEDEKRQLDSLQRDVLGPLRWLGGGEAIRVVIDGLDQLATASSAAVHAALDALVTDPGLSRVRLVVTSRPDTPRPAGASEVRLDVAPDADIRSYLARRKVPESLHGAIAVRAGGNWLIASLLADQALKSPGIAPESLPSDLAGLYAQNLRQAGAWATERWRGEFRPVLGALAAAGVGPILPLKLLCAASVRLGGPDRPPRVRDRLVDLRGLVVRARPGTDDEHVGLFHQTLADYLLDPASDPFGIDPQEPHRALAEAIAELAPAESHDPADPLHRYAAAREAEHLWALGEYGRVVESLAHRQSVIPAENLKRWQSWKARIESKLGPDHPDTLTTRHNIAFWTGEVGDAREALRLFTELLPDQERVLGRDHPDTLTTRNNIATWTGEVGDAREALRLSRALLPDQERVLGRDHPDTLTTRNNIAYWTGRVGDAREALRLFAELLPDQERVLGRDHPDTLTTRNNIAFWTGEVGDAREALRLSAELLPDQERVLGRDHPDTLRTRNNIASWTGRGG